VRCFMLTLTTDTVVAWVLKKEQNVEKEKKKEGREEGEGRKSRGLKTLISSSALSSR
jgi:hypothetical protein